MGGVNNYSSDLNRRAKLVVTRAHTMTDRVQRHFSQGPQHLVSQFAENTQSVF